MPSTVYKGDVSEVLFAPETGMIIRHGTDVTMTASNSGGVTTITFTGETNTTQFIAGKSSLKYPKNGLVGSQVTFTGLGNDTDGKIFTIIENHNQFLKISPAMASTTFSSGDTLFILPYKTPPMDTVNHEDRADTFTDNTCDYNNDPTIAMASTALLEVGMFVTGTGIPANAYVASITDSTNFELSAATTGGTVTNGTLTFTRSNKATSDPDESFLIDQFLGIANAIALPETKVDLKRYHVVGLGRDTSVQVPGKYITEGGSFEVNLHSARWLKYCLGNEIIGDIGTSTETTTLGAKAHAGESHVSLAATANAGVGKYILFKDTASSDKSPVVDIVTDHAATQGTWDGSIDDRDFDKANAYEIRRIIGVHESANTLVYLDQPLSFTHASGSDVALLDYDDISNTKAPDVGVISSTSQTITNAVTHLLYGRSEVPSFCLEVSQRRSDVRFSSSGAIGTGTDSKELTRVYRGCKVSDFTLTTDNDAALRLSVNFNSALTYTDVGRLEAPGTSTSRYQAHRMFDDIADTNAKRLKAGIGVGTQKPFMFYNGQIKTAGITVAQVLSFSLTGSTGMQGFHTINNTHTSTDSAESAVPFAGSRNTSIMVEGQTSYEMTMEIVVDDPVFFHKMRAGTSFSVAEEGATTNQIVVEFEKQARGSTTASNTEKIVLLIDEYYIVEAPMQIPDDKGVMKSSMKIMPKSIKVLARDTILKY